MCGGGVCVGGGGRAFYYTYIYSGKDSPAWVWGGGIVEDMCYETRRAEACASVD